MLSRMHGLEYLWRDVVLVPLAGVVALVLVAWAGCLRPTALERAPGRDVGMGARDLIVALALMCLGTIVAAEVLAGWVGPGEGGGGDAHAGAAGSPTLPPVQLLQQALVGQVLVHLPVALYALWRSGGQPAGMARLGVWPGRPLRDCVAAMLGLLAAVPMALGLAVVVTLAGEWLLDQPAPLIGHDMLHALRQARLWRVKAGLLASALVVAPVLEEMVFRGMAQTALLGLVGRSRRWLVVVLASVAFALMHAGQPWQVLPSLFVLGVVLGWLYERTGSLLPSVLVHAGFNAVNVALAVGWAPAAGVCWQ